MKKIFILFTLVLCLFSLTACKNKVTSIKIVENSVPEIIDVANLDSELTKIQIELMMKKGDSSFVNLSKDMISTEDYTKLTNLGTNTVIVSYEEFTTSLTLTVEDSNAYVVKVVYPNGTPVSGGVSVQWCTNSTCMLPVYVNEQGVARNSIPDDNYFIHIDGIPTGYTYNPNAYTATKNSKTVEIELISLINLTNDGSVTNPYVTAIGAFTVNYTTGGATEVKYFSFTPEEAGTYSIKSLAVDKLATNTIDPYIGFLGTVTDFSAADYSGNSSEVLNFNYSFTAEANVTYYFAVMVTTATRYPASFDIQISK